MKERAVSEVLGYMLILSIVVAAISMVYLKVNDMVESTSEKFRVEGVRQSFKRILNVVSISTYGGAPLQSIQVELQGGSFWIANETRIKLTAGNVSIDEFVGSLNYELENFRVSLENGAVWEDYYGYKRPVEEPRIFIHTTSESVPSGTTRTVAVVVITKFTGNVSIAGQGSVKLIFNTTSVDIYSEDVYGNMTLSVTSPFAKLWFEFFSTLPGDTVLNNDTAILRTYVDRIVVAKYNVEVRVES